MNAPRSRVGSYLALAIFLGASAAVFLWLFNTAGGSLGIASSYRVWATLPDAFALNSGAEVTAAGVSIGSVSTIKTDGQQAAIELQIDPRYTPIPRSTTIQLGTKSLVGESYIELRMGDPSYGYEPNGGTLPAVVGEQPVQVDQVLNALTADTRRAVTNDLRSLGLAVDNRGSDINQTLANLGAISGNGGHVLSILAAQAPQLAQLVTTSQDVFAALNQRESRLQELIVDANRTATAAASRDRQLRQAIALLPRTLAIVQDSANRLAELGRTGTPVVANLATAVQGLTPAIRALPAAARAGRQLSDHLPILATSLTPILRHLSQFSAATQPVAAPLRRALTELLPFVSYLRPYANDLAGWFATMADAGGWFDGIGHMVAVQMLFDEQTLASLPPTIQQSVDQIKSLSPLAPAGPTSTNPYPDPRTAGRPQRRASPPQHVGTR